MVYLLIFIINKQVERRFLILIILILEHVQIYYITVLVWHVSDKVEQ